MKNPFWKLMLRTVEPGAILFVRDMASPLPDPAKMISALVLDLRAQNVPLSAVAARLSVYWPALEDKSELCILFDNRYSLLRLLRRAPKEAAPGFSLREIKRLLRKSGHTPDPPFSLWPMSPHNYELSGYGIPGPVSGRTGLKKLFLKFITSPGLRVLHPSFALSATRAIKKESVLPALIRELKFGKMERCITGNPDTLLLMNKERLVRIPLQPDSLARCRLSASILQRLQKQPFRSKAPRLHNRGRFQGFEYFVEERLPGLAFDTPGPLMAGFMDKAAAHLIEFHKATACPAPLSHSQFQRLFTRPVRLLLPNLEPLYRATLSELLRNIEACCIGKSFVSVWQHGDYKIENILFDPEIREITGLIDWDLSQQSGLPLLDLFYLFFYNAALVEKRSLPDILFWRLEAPSLFTVRETEMLTAYLDKLGLGRNWIHPLFVLFIVHHFARRLRSADLTGQKELCKNSLAPLLMRLSRTDPCGFERK